MDTIDTDSITMNANVIDLSAHEREAYLRYLITNMGDFDSQHERLTAKAYQAILDCLEADAKLDPGEAHDD